MRLVNTVVLLGCGLLVSTPAQAQNPRAQPAYGTVRLTGGFLPDPHHTQLTAGGSIEVTLVGCAYGNVANAPDVDLVYSASGGRTLYIHVMANEDATLLINMPNGTWVCDDDSFGNRNPIVVLSRKRISLRASRRSGDPIIVTSVPGRFFFICTGT